MIAKDKMRDKAVGIFDFDGTLVDSMGAFADLAADLMERAYSLPWNQARQNYLDTSGLPFFQQLECLFPGNDSNASVARAFEEQKKQNYHKSAYFQEVPEAIGRLQSQGLRVVVSSNNGQKLVEEFLKNPKGPKMEFDLVLGFREGFAKGPDHFDKILKHFGQPVEQAFFVGDSLQDAQKAVNFGIDFVGKLGTFDRESFQENYPQVPLVSDLRELTEVVCK